MNLLENDEDDGLSRTIEAGDPSLFKPLPSPGRFNKFDAASLLSLNNDYDRMLAENYTELKMKCLNDLNMIEANKQKKKNVVVARGVEKSRSTVSAVRRPVQNLTHVDVRVPSGRQRSHEVPGRRVAKNFKSGN